MAQEGTALLVVAMPTGGGGDADRGTAPRATFFLDPDSASVRDFTEQVIAGASSPRERASLLFAAVRDRVWYDPYSVSRDPAHYRASYVLEAGRAYCVPKAVLLTAVLRAVGIPARLGFADVRNHLQTDTLRAVMGGTDLFVYHGYCSVHLDGRWMKATPAFNVELCERFDVPPVDFDGQSDALMHAFTLRRHPAHGVRAGPRQLRRPPAGPDPDGPRADLRPHGPRRRACRRRLHWSWERRGGRRACTRGPVRKLGLSTLASTDLVLTSEVAR